MLGCDEEKYKNPVNKIVKFLINHIDKKTNKEGHFDGGTLDLWSITYARSGKACDESSRE